MCIKIYNTITEEYQFGPLHLMIKRWKSGRKFFAYSVQNLLVKTFARYWLLAGWSTYTVYNISTVLNKYFESLTPHLDIVSSPKMRQGVTYIIDLTAIFISRHVSNIVRTTDMAGPITHQRHENNVSNTNRNDVNYYDEDNQVELPSAFP